MAYYIDAKKVMLDDLLLRIRETDLIPSRVLLLEDIDENFCKLKRSGILTLSDFRTAVKNAGHIAALAAKTTISSEYLTLLRREVEGYFPKAVPLSDFYWLDKFSVAELAAKGYKNTVLLYEALTASTGEGLYSSIATDHSFRDQISSLADLTRIQWVSPLAAKMLFDAGYKNVKSVAEADAQALYRAFDELNAAGKYFKGKIGLRDVKRLVKAASYVI